MGMGKFSRFRDCTNNRVEENLISDVMLVGSDGGGVYTLGQQPGTQIVNNYIRHQENLYGCLYLDEGSAFITAANNVCDRAPNWLMLNTKLAVAIHDNYVDGNYTNVGSMYTTDENNRLMNNVITNTTIISDDDWPIEAMDIMEKAGLQESFYYLHDWLEDAAE